MADAPTLRDILTLCFWKPETKEEKDILRRKFSPKTISDLRRLFRLYDADGGGTISRDEFIEALRSLNRSSKPSRTRNIYDSGETGAQTRGMLIIEAQIGEIIARADSDGNQELDFEEFVGMMGPSFEPDAPFVPDLDGRYRPKLVPDAAEIAEEEDPLDKAAREAREAKDEAAAAAQQSAATHEDSSDLGAGAAGGGDEWLADL
jgi:Ca2+-binding EF-hand superfamily protein